MKYKGWYIEFFGTGYRLTRVKTVDGKVVVKTADSITRAKTIITNEEDLIQKRRGKYAQ